LRRVGIDTPEIGTPCGGPATEHLRALIAGRPVTLVAAPGREDRDGHGQPLRYSKTQAATSDADEQLVALADGIWSPPSRGQPPGLPRALGDANVVDGLDVMGSGREDRGTGGAP
jgi:hypothetical protein